MAISFVVTEGFGPVTGGGNGTLQIVSVVANPTSIVITFGVPVTIGGAASVPANWTITPVGGAPPITVLGITAPGTTIITLSTTEGKIGGSYILNIPIGVVRFSDGSPLTPPYTQAFTGAGVAPIVSMIVTNQDARTFDVVFSESVVESEALNKANYSIVPPLTLNQISKVSDNRFKVTTLQSQTPGQTYVVTASNIHDQFGNLI